MFYSLLFFYSIPPIELERELSDDRLDKDRLDRELFELSDDLLLEDILKLLNELDELDELNECDELDHP